MRRQSSGPPELGGADAEKLAKLMRGLRSVKHVGFVKRSDFDLIGSPGSRGIALGDVDGDGNIELCVGSVDGVLNVFKNSGSKPWLTTGQLGTILCVQVIKLVTGEPSIAVLSAEGWCRLLRVAVVDGTERLEECGGLRRLPRNTTNMVFCNLSPPHQQAYSTSCHTHVIVGGLDRTVYLYAIVTERTRLQPTQQHPARQSTRCPSSGTTDNKKSHSEGRAEPSIPLALDRHAAEDGAAAEKQPAAAELTGGGVLPAELVEAGAVQDVHLAKIRHASVAAFANLSFNAAYIPASGDAPLQGGPVRERVCDVGQGRDVIPAGVGSDEPIQTVDLSTVSRTPQSMLKGSSLGVGSARGAGVDGLQGVGKRESSNSNSTHANGGAAPAPSVQTSTVNNKSILSMYSGGANCRHHAAHPAAHPQAAGHGGGYKHRDADASVGTDPTSDTHTFVVVSSYRVGKPVTSIDVEKSSDNSLIVVGLTSNAYAVIYVWKDDRGRDILAHSRAATVHLVNADEPPLGGAAKANPPGTTAGRPGNGGQRQARGPEGGVAGLNPGQGGQGGGSGSQPVGVGKAPQVGLPRVASVQVLAAAGVRRASVASAATPPSNASFGDAELRAPASPGLRDPAGGAQAHGADPLQSPRSFFSSPGLAVGLDESQYSMQPSSPLTPANDVLYFYAEKDPHVIHIVVGGKTDIDQCYIACRARNMAIATQEVLLGLAFTSGERELELTLCTWNGDVFFNDVHKSAARFSLNEP
eukprot:gene5757-8814_t